jgi:hypothetical protein
MQQLRERRGVALCKVASVVKVSESSVKLSCRSEDRLLNSNDSRST